MPTIQLQRTLLVGLGEVGATVIDLLLAELARQLGQVSLVQGVAVVSAETTFTHLETPLLISPEATFETWRTDFVPRVEVALRQISQLDHLVQLNQRGITFRRQDEIHIIIVANLAELWVQPTLAELPQVLRQAVEQTLACQTGLSGLLLDAGPTDNERPESDRSPVRFNLSELVDLAGQFDRGCFLAGLANEVGLIIGQVDRLTEQTAYFLMLLLRESPAAGLDWEGYGPAGWGTALTSFGLTVVRWPGPELTAILSTRWSQALLQQMLTLSESEQMATGDPAQQTRTAVQQWLTGRKLVPPLLLDRLATLMPPLPQPLDNLVPEPPWPWLMGSTQADLENAVQRWQENWLTAAREKIASMLSELQGAWSQEVETWLVRQLEQIRQGRVLLAQSYLAAMSEQLDAFVEGITAKLEEAETDLVTLDQQLSRTAAALAKETASFPTSPMATLFYWGRWPFHWPKYWARCRQAQTIARNFAHLSRGRLLAWQTVCYYEEILPFYHQLLADWRELVQNWHQICRLVINTAAAPELSGWSERLDQCLAASGGPWTEGMVSALYQVVIEQQADTVWEQIGTLGDWVAEAVETDTLIHRLQKETVQHLAPAMAIPADQALCRQLPQKKAQTEWLAGLAEQARPFWRYDETSLSESFRGQMHVETWVLLPGGEKSPLAHLVRDWSPSPVLLTSDRPEEIGIVTLRRIVQAGLEDEE